MPLLSLTISLVLLLCPLATISVAQEPNALILGDTIWTPILYRDANTRALKGVEVEIVKEISKRTGIPIRIEAHPWRRVLKMTRQGKIHIAGLLLHTSEREDYLIYTIPVLSVDMPFYHDQKRTPTLRVNSFADLAPYTLGMISGLAYPAPLEEAINKYSIRIKLSRSPDSGFRTLMAGRTDLFVANAIQAGAFLANNPLYKGKFHPAGPALIKAHYHLAVSRKAGLDWMLPKLNQAISDMKREGVIRKITAPWDF